MPERKLIGVPVLEEEYAEIISRARASGRAAGRQLLIEWRNCFLGGREKAVEGGWDGVVSDHGIICNLSLNVPANARLIAAAPELLAALHEGRRAIGDHIAPGDCYATGPLAGNAFRDLVQCPACSFIAMCDAAIAKATGQEAAS